MPVTPGFVEATVSQLQKARPIRSKPMFGGLGIYLDEVFFCVADDDRLYFKVDPETVASYEEKGMGPWMLGGDPNLNYREVPPDVFADVDTLGEWIDASAEAAVRLKKKTKKR
jgi:DNA transformation protein